MPKADQRNNYTEIPGLSDYVEKNLICEPASIAKIRLVSPSQGLPPWQAGPTEGKLLEMLARSARAKRAVDIGTLGGYSAAWIAQALPHNGKLYTLEYNPNYAACAAQNLRNAGLAKKVEIIVGDANVTLKKLSKKGPFDFCFLDADKTGYPAYLRWAIKNVRSGGIVAADNAYLHGKLHLKPSQAGQDSTKVNPMQEFLKLLTHTRHFSFSTMIPTGEGLAVGIKK